MSGFELRLWMQARGISVERLAEKLGVHERTVFRWRRGPFVPPFLDLALQELDRRP